MLLANSIKISVNGFPCFHNNNITLLLDSFTWGFICNASAVWLCDRMGYGVNKKSQIFWVWVPPGPMFNNYNVEHWSQCQQAVYYNLIYSRTNSFSIWIGIKSSKSYFEQKEVHKTNVTWQTSYLFYFNVKFYVIPKKLFYELCFYKYIIAIRQFLRWQSFW